MRPEGNSGVPLRLVVGGGIGSGKSTVLQTLQTLNVYVIEADRVGHAVLEPDGPAFGEVAAAWPAVVAGGRIDRGLLAAIVFDDEEQLKRLERLTHPHIAAEIYRLVDAHRDRDIAVELPLTVELLGPGWTRLVVDAPEENRRRRAVARGLSDDDVSSRMAAQPALEEWVAGADIVVDNSGSISDLENEVRALVGRLRSDAETPGTP